MRRCWGLAVGVAIALVLAGAGCSTDGPGDGPPAAKDPPPTRPVDFEGPDPAVLAADGSYWLFTTSADGLLVPVRRATGAGTWGPPTEALARRPAWAGQDTVWAPGVMEVEGRFVLWLTSPTDADDDLSQCIGPAVSDAPGGPYEPLGDEPLMCGTDGPTIDPFPWRAADGRLYVAWTQYHYKSGEPTEIRASALDDSGTRLVGEPARLLTDPSGWEKLILENPALIARDDGTVRLLYSGGFYFTADYATGTATCEGPLGPCERDTPGRPWHRRGKGMNGPGGMSVFTGHDGQVWTVFHAWGDRVGYDRGGRRSPHVVRLADLPPLP